MLKYPHPSQVSATHQRLVLELSDLQAESTDCGEDEQGSATASNGGVSTVGGAGRDFVQHGSGMRYSTSHFLLKIFKCSSVKMDVAAVCNIEVHYPQAA